MDDKKKTPEKNGGRAEKPGRPPKREGPDSLPPGKPPEIIPVKEPSALEQRRAVAWREYRKVQLTLGCVLGTDPPKGWTP